MYRGGQTQSLPLKLNYAGVMPIIFGQALLLFPCDHRQHGLQELPAPRRTICLRA